MVAIRTNHEDHTADARSVVVISAVGLSLVDGHMFDQTFINLNTHTIPICTLNSSERAAGAGRPPDCVF